MHEMALTRSIVEIVEAEAAQRGFTQVRTIRLAVGALSCVEPDALDFCFSSVARGSVAEGAALTIDRVPARAWCWDCEREKEVARRGDPCGGCGGHRLDVRGGDDLKITELEVA